MNNKNFKKNYEQYLRKKYSLPDSCEILVKQGHITKENETPQIMNLTQRGKLLQAQFRTYKLIYDEIKDEILKTYSIIDRAKEDVEILEIQNIASVKVFLMHFIEALKVPNIAIDEWKKGI